jgi:hypothetical protein
MRKRGYGQSKRAKGFLVATDMFDGALLRTVSRD